MGMIFGKVLFALIIAAIIILMISLIRRGGHYHGHWHDYYHGENKSGALDILKERYAKGEITKEQYKSMKKNSIITTLKHTILDLGCPKVWNFEPISKRINLSKSLQDYF